MTGDKLTKDNLLAVGEATRVSEPGAGYFAQGWEFAHLISEQIARFLSKKE